MFKVMICGNLTCHSFLLWVHYYMKLSSIILQLMIVSASQTLIDLTKKWNVSRPVVLFVLQIPCYSQRGI